MTSNSMRVKDFFMVDSLNERVNMVLLISSQVLYFK